MRVALWMAFAGILAGCGDACGGGVADESSAVEKAGKLGAAEQATREAGAHEVAGGGQHDAAHETKAKPSGLMVPGTPAPARKLADQDGKMRSLRDAAGNYVAVYFYPRDATPGCTVEAQEFRDAKEMLAKEGVQVFGVSTDDVASHKAFAQAESLNFPLLADVDGKLAADMGVPVRMGFTKRVTFLIGPSGQVVQVFPDVSPSGHAGEVVRAVQAHRRKGAKEKPAT